MRKYSDEQIKMEAKLFLEGNSIRKISDKLNVPKSTISWHLIHPLKRIDFESWIIIRSKLIGSAKDLLRLHNEMAIIESYNQSIDGKKSLFTSK